MEEILNKFKKEQTDLLYEEDQNQENKNLFNTSFNELNVLLASQRSIKTKYTVSACNTPKIKKDKVRV